MIAERLSCVSVSPYRRLSQTNCSLLSGARESSPVLLTTSWRRLRVSSHQRFLGSPAHACNVSWAHHTISLDSDAATHRAAAGTRHGGRARRPSAPTTPAGRGAAEYAVVPSTPPPAVDTPEGSASAQTLAAWYRAGRCEDRPRAALPAVLEVRDAASHPSMAH